MDFDFEPHLYITGSYLSLPELSRLARQDPTMRPMLREQLKMRLDEALRLIPFHPTLLIDLYTEEIFGQEDIEVYVRQGIRSNSTHIVNMLVREGIITINDIEDIADQMLANGLNQLNSGPILSLVELLFSDYDLYSGSLAPAVMGIQRHALPIVNYNETFDQLLDVMDNLHRQFGHAPPILINAAIHRLADTLLFSTSTAFMYIEDGTNPVIQLLNESPNSLLQTPEPNQDLINDLRTAVSNSVLLRYRLQRLIAYLTPRQ